MLARGLCNYGKRHNEEFHDLYSLQSIIRMITCRRMRWAGYMARMGRRAMFIHWWENEKEKDY
jgi:hypothetical protein